MTLEEYKKGDDFANKLVAFIFIFSMTTMGILYYLDLL